MSEPRLPQIDPVTFAALTTLDTFLARAPLTRAEHAEANKSIQHLVQTLEALQGTVKQLNAAKPAFIPPLANNGIPQPSANPAIHSSSPAPGADNGGRIVAGIAEEIFRNAK